MYPNEAIEKIKNPLVTTRAEHMAKCVHRNLVLHGREELLDVHLERIHLPWSALRMVFAPYQVVVVELGKLPLEIPRKKKPASPRDRAIRVPRHLGVYKRLGNSDYCPNKYGVVDIRRNDVSHLAVFDLVEHDRKAKLKFVGPQPVLDFLYDVSDSVFVHHVGDAVLSASRAPSVFVVYRIEDVVLAYDSAEDVPY